MHMDIHPRRSLGDHARVSLSGTAEECAVVLEKLAWRLLPPISDVVGDDMDFDDFGDFDDFDGGSDAKA